MASKFPERTASFPRGPWLWGPSTSPVW
jgi:hypothetical protein